MTVKQAQCLLIYLGYSPGLPDNVAGTKTSGATSAFQGDYGLTATGQLDDTTCKMLVAAVAGTAEKVDKQKKEVSSAAEKYLQSDGCYHIPRGVDVQLSRNLWAHEVHCQGVGCCQESIISKKMVEMFQDIRDEYGDSIQIGDAGGSGYRCKIHNVEEGGAVNSLHLTGAAFDLHPKNISKLVGIVGKKLCDGEYGVYPWGVHVGVWNRGYVSRFR